MTTTLSISIEDPDSPDACRLMACLSDHLSALTGASGRASFDTADARAPRALFAVARAATGVAVGCGALRPLEGDIAEIKRMYAAPATRGVGSALLGFLEAQAAGFGYRAIRLETRLVNRHAIGFYERHGYLRIENYGRYAGRPEAACFEKRLDGAG